MCFGVCWTRDAGRFSKTFIKSKRIWLHPLAHVWSMTLVCLLFPSILKAICSSPTMEPGSLSLVHTDVNKAPHSLSLREHVFHKQSGKRRSLFSPFQSIPPSLSCVPFQSSLVSSLVRTGGLVSWYPRWSWALKQAYKSQKLVLVSCVSSYLSQ